MKLELSRRTDLALRSLRTLSARAERLPRAELAEAAGTSPDFLAKVLAPLVREGWLGSEPGRGGGCCYGGPRCRRVRRSRRRQTDQQGVRQTQIPPLSRRPADTPRGLAARGRRCAVGNDRKCPASNELIPR